MNPEDEVFHAALHVLRTLHQHGFQAFFAGGCVRDRLLGAEARDYDIATDARPDDVIALFEKVVTVGAHFGVCVVVMGDVQVEVATFREDAAYPDGRRPQRVRFVTPREDAKRRDFTVNGMFWDPIQDRVHDYVGGMRDLKDKVVRAIGDPKTRLMEDHLRVLRAIRFAATLDFVLEERTADAVRSSAAWTAGVSGERICREMQAMLLHPSRGRALSLMSDLGVLAVLFPELEQTKGIAQPEAFHPEGDVWTHTLICMRQLVRPSWTLALGTLLHDIGKPPTIMYADRIRFHNHDRVGARLAQDVCRRMRMSREETERVTWLVANHMCFKDVPNMRPGKRKRLLRQEGFPELLAMHRADVLGSFRDLSTYAFCQKEMASLTEEDRKPPRLLGGDDLIAMGLTPGPVFSSLLDAVEEAQLEGSVKTRDDALDLVRGILRKEAGS